MFPLKINTALVGLIEGRVCLDGEHKEPSTLPSPELSSDNLGHLLCAGASISYLPMSLPKFHISRPLLSLSIDPSLNALSLINLSFSHSHYSTSNSHTSHYLSQFLPLAHSTFQPLNTITARERRLLVLGLSTAIKTDQVFALKVFSLRFCPFFLVKIMKMFDTRHAAFAFFKLAFGDNSEETVRLSCVAAHVLSAQGLQLLAQDMVSWLIARVGAGRTNEIVEFMWRNHAMYESDFSVLNTLLRGFLNLGMSLEALEVLRMMRDVRVRPGLSSLTILLRLLLRVGDYGSVWKVFRDMIHKGPCPSNITFNMMIYGFCRQQKVAVAESLLHLMPKFMCSPGVITFNILINACCVRGRTSVAFDWLHLMLNSGCEPSFATLTTIMHALCREGNVGKAHKLLDEIQDMGIAPNAAMYNTLMDGYFKAREVGQASLLYEDMRTKGVSPDCVTFNILVGGHYKYGRKEDWDRFLKDLIVSGLFPDCSLCDVTVSGLCWTGRHDEAMALLLEILEKGLTVSVVAFNSLIGAYSRAGLEDKAFEAYLIMVKCGLTPSSSTCNSLLMSLCRKGWLQEARILFYGMLEKGFPINKVSYTVLLDGHFKMNDLDGARFLWKQMKERGMYPDVVAFTALIDGLSKAGKVEEAYEVFLQMSAMGFVPNNFAYNSLIGGLCDCGRMTEALKLEKEMRQKGLLSDTFTFNIIIDGYCRRGQMKFAIDIFNDMQRIGLLPDIFTFNILIGGYCKAFDMVGAGYMVNRMYSCGLHPDITTYNVRMHGYCRMRKMNQAVIILDQLISAGIVPGTVTYNTMLNGICSDILDRAMILTAKLLKMGFIPNVITTNMLLSQFCKQGMPEKALLWGKKLMEISFDFDEISYTILDQANSLKQDDAELPFKRKGNLGATVRVVEVQLGGHRFKSWNQPVAYDSQSFKINLTVSYVKTNEDKETEKNEAKAKVNVERLGIESEAAVPPNVAMSKGRNLVWGASSSLIIQHLCPNAFAPSGDKTAHKGENKERSPKRTAGSGNGNGGRWQPGDGEDGGGSDWQRSILCRGLGCVMCWGCIVGRDCIARRVSQVGDALPVKGWGCITDEGLRLAFEIGDWWQQAANRANTAIEHLGRVCLGCSKNEGEHTVLVVSLCAVCCNGLALERNSSAYALMEIVPLYCIRGLRHMGRAEFNCGSEKPVGALQGALPLKPFTEKYGIIVRILYFLGGSWI
ncbi:unnamed protein product [Sphenostylis stenocarpa]|uniref:Pentatricopeptide repeat-containing protein n=1 Tax=Sphenostylis stenocarpa TaxID=92480 RepID=A0AA86SFV8_9FABA|nr:unnamed protein product [Sphenostylis stenocarpa]